MGKFKKALILVFLVVASCCCLTSCSCSFGTNRNKNSDGGGGDSGGGTTPSLATYTVTVDINNSDGGFYTSSTGEDSHTAGSSPVYTITPNSGWCIDSIKIDNTWYYNSSLSGYSFEPKEVTIGSISANTTISVSFVQLYFTVSAVVLDSGYSSSLGGQVVELDQNANWEYLGGSDASFSVVPNSGYIINRITVNNDVYYSYVAGDQRAYSAMQVDIYTISKNTSIKVEMFKLVDVQNLLLNYHTSVSSQGTTTESLRPVGESLVSYSIDSYSDYVVPNGAACSISLLTDDYTAITYIEISSDGGVSYDEKFEANSFYFGNYYYFDPSSNLLFFDYFSSDIIVKVYTESTKVSLVLFNYDNKTASERVDVLVNSHYVIQSWMKDYDWFYSTANAYQESNTHTPLEVVEDETAGGVKVYSILLKPEYISNAQGAIILIYKSK